MIIARFFFLLFKRDREKKNATTRWLKIPMPKSDVVVTMIIIIINEKLRVMLFSRVWNVIFIILAQCSMFISIRMHCHIVFLFLYLFVLLFSIKFSLFIFCSLCEISCFSFDTSWKIEKPDKSIKPGKPYGPIDTKRKQTNIYKN